MAGKQAVQVYVQAPQGKLGKAARVLVGFAKTDILPAGASQTVEITVPDYWMSSYDDSGKTKHKSCYVMEQGTYTVFAGFACHCQAVPF